MAGNAAEWVADAWTPTLDSAAPTTDRGIRGGSSRSNPSDSRCAARAHNEPEFRAHWLGFRIVRGR